jgi:hypothetical protein
MNDNSIGDLQRLSARAVFEHEAHDFTTWLEENIDALGEAIGVPLTAPEREQPGRPRRSSPNESGCAKSSSANCFPSQIERHLSFPTSLRRRVAVSARVLDRAFRMHTASPSINRVFDCGSTRETRKQKTMLLSTSFVSTSTSSKQRSMLL